MNIVSLVLLIVALVLNLRAYRKTDESKKFQAQIGLALMTISASIIGAITISNLT